MNVIQRKNHRYFYITDKTQTSNQNFRAEFVDIIHNTLICKLINYDNHECNGLVSYPINWIILSLDDIVMNEKYILDKDSKSISLFLPKDILNIIDLYL